MAASGWRALGRGLGGNGGAAGEHAQLWRLVGAAAPDLAAAAAAAAAHWPQLALCAAELPSATSRLLCLVTSAMTRGASLPASARCVAARPPARARSYEASEFRLAVYNASDLSLSGEQPKCMAHCNELDLSDGICDAECNSTACFYDGGDCLVTRSRGTCDWRTRAGCPSSWIGDGVCDEECFVEECE